MRSSTQHKGVDHPNVRRRRPCETALRSPSTPCRRGHSEGDLDVDTTQALERQAGANPSATTSSRIDVGRLRAILVGSVGNLVEWYDFYCYAAFSLYFAASFFPAA